MELRKRAETGPTASPGQFFPEFSKKKREEANYLSQRERNREAVRNCRKRKKQQAETLQRRIEEVKRRNTDLREAIRKGDEGIGQIEGTEQSLSIDTVVQEMQRAFNLDDDVKPSGAVDKVVKLFLKKFLDHGQDKKKTISFIVANMQKLIDPVALTSSYFCLMTADTDDTGKKGQELIKHLELDTRQLEKLDLRTTHATRILCEMKYTQKRMRSIWTRLYHSKPSADSMYHLNSILSPNQLAKFFIWVYTNPACKDILDRLWVSMLKKYEPAIRRELESSPEFKSMKRVMRRASARLVANVFHSKEKGKEETLRKILHKDVLLTDVNNGGENRGVDGVLRYVSKIQSAFQYNSMKTKEMSMEEYELENKITSCVVDNGLYIGKLNTGKEPVPVQFTAVLDIYFGDPAEPEKITEYVVSWDVLSVFEQVRAFNNLHTPKLSAKPELTTDRIKEVATQLVHDVKELLSTSETYYTKGLEPSFIENVALHELFDGIVHHGFEEVVIYAKKLNKAFTNMKMVSEEVKEIKPEPNSDLHRVEVSWKLDAKYTGSLTEDERDTTLVANLSVLFDANQSEVHKVFIMFDCKNLFRQIGLLK